MIGLLAALAFIGGCATGGKDRSKSAPMESSAGQGPTVAPLPEGRQGFVIREVPQLGEASRRDFDRAVDLLEAQDYQGAAELLETVIGASPGVTAPYINLAIAYRHLDQPEKAEGHLKTALELVPDHPVACNELGLLYRKSGRFDEARAMYEQALAGFPQYLPAHRNLGILCDLYLGDLECALEHYEVYSRARPEDEQVQLWIADLRLRLGIN
ncbi:MAG TPA: tetratricopeptide repeat protein [Desulfobacterales bacterium]